MHAVKLIFAVGWAAFWVYWIASAFTMKRGRVSWSREIGIRFVLVALVVILLRAGAFRRHAHTPNVWLIVLGFVLFGLGLAFAIWARLNIGRNWGTPMSQKADLELVTTGPYRLVRHPIYSGILIAGLGTAAALGWTWLIAVALAGVYFGYSSVVEERFLAKALPDTYPSYQRSTKRFLPFIF